MTNARVAIAIITHDSAPDLPGCLAAVGDLEGPRPELVIVDCASADDSAEVARAHLPPAIDARILPLAENVGFAGGMNRALAATTAPFVLTLNADVRPAPDFLLRLLGRMEALPGGRVGAVAGRLSRLSGAGQRRLLDACGMQLTPSWRHLDRGSGEIDRGQWSAPAEVFGATGAASLFRRAALEDAAIDGEVFLDEFHSFREDAELCFRLRERGWRVLYEPSARARHRRRNLPERRAAMPAAVNYHSLKNRYLLRAYHQTARNLMLTLAPALWRDLMAVGYVLLRERSSLSAYTWLWRRRRSILDRRRRIQQRRTRPAAELDRWFFRQGKDL